MSRQINSSTALTAAAGEAVRFANGNGFDAVTSQFPNRRARTRLESFPTTMPLGQFLFE